MTINEIFFQNSRTIQEQNALFFRIPGIFQDQGHFQGLFKVSANPVEGTTCFKRFNFCSVRLVDEILSFMTALKGNRLNVRAHTF